MKKDNVLLIIFTIGLLLMVIPILLTLFSIHTYIGMIVVGFITCLCVSIFIE